MKKFKKFLAILLVASMIFTTNSVSILAEGQANESESYESRDDQQEEILDKNGSEEENSESLADEEAEPEEDTESKKESFEEEAEEAEEAEEEEETETVESASEEEEQSESESDAEETSEEASGKELNENKKGSDGLYGTAENPFLYIYYVDNMYTPNEKDGHVHKMQVNITEFIGYVTNPNDPYQPFNGMLQDITNQVPDKMTLKGFHLVSDQNLPDDWKEADEIFAAFEQNYTHDGSVDYANAASISFTGEHDVVLYTVYDSISFKVMYFDENDTMQTETFDTNNVENDLYEFLLNIEQIEIEGKTFKGYKQLTTEDEISGYTGEATSDDSDGNFAVLVSFNNWKENPNASVTWAAYYKIIRYFNVIYIKDHADFVSKTNSYKTYTTSNSASSFTGTNGDINKLYKIGPYYDNDDFFETVGIEEVSSFTSQSELAALVASSSTCLGTSGSYDITLLDDKFDEWYNNGYPTKNACWVVKYAGAYRWYAASTNQLGGGPSNVNNVDLVRRQFFGLTYSDSAFADYNEFYSYTQGTWIPKLKSFKGLKIVPYTEILTANPTDIRKYYLQNYYFNEDAVNDTDLKTPAELEQIYKAWTESNDDIYNSYAAFIVYETAPKELQEFGFGTYPTKMTYFEGETFNPAALVLTLVFKNGYPNESLAYAGNEDKITFELPSGEDALTTALARDGNNNTVAITVKYGGCSNTFNLTVNEVPKAIDSISVATPPNTSYIEGQKFDPAGLVLKVNYDDNTSEDIIYNDTTKNDFTFNPNTNTALTTGNTSVTITYGGKSTSLPLTVSANAVDSITIDNEPKTKYKTSDKFSLDHLIILVEYANGDKEYIEYRDDNKNDFSFEIDGIGTVDENTTIKVEDNILGDVTVKVTYKGKSANYSINVKTIINLQGLNINTTTYTEGKTFDPTGLKFRVVYTDGTTETTETIDYAVTQDGITFEPSITTPLKTTDDKVKVSYKGASYDINLTVNPEIRTVASVSITKFQDKTEYEPGESFDGTGMEIRVIYDNGDEEIIPYNTDFIFSPSVLEEEGDEIEVAVQYKGVNSGNKSKVKVIKQTTPNPPMPPNPPSPQKPSNPSNNNGGTGGTGGGGSDSGSSDPTKGPMGDLSKKPTNVDSGHKIPENKLFKNTQLMASHDKNDSSMFNAEDVDANVGYGKWIQIEQTPTWHFLTYDFDFQKNNNKPLGFLANGWYKVDWDGIDKWYYFDQEGVMKMGWFSENGKIYYLQEALNDHWYGSMQTGAQYINGVKYIFDDKGALIIQ